MKDKRDPPVEEPGGTALPDKSRSAARLPGVRTIVASLIILIPGLILESQGQLLHSPDSGSPVAPVPGSSLALRVEERRQHPSYQVFAGQLALPVITIVNATTLEVGVKLKIDVRRLDQVTQRESLAGQFSVPVGVIDKLWVSGSNSLSSDAVQMAAKLRVTVIDYKFLLERWTRYRPPTGKESVKTDALLALQSGEIDKAWEMYVGLPRPQPPGGLRIVSEK